MGRDSNGEDMWFTPYPGMSPQIMTDENAGLKWLDIEGSALPSGVLPEGMLFTQDLEKIQPFGRQLTAFDVTLDMLVKDNQANVLTNSQVCSVAPYLDHQKEHYQDLDAFQ